MNNTTITLSIKDAHCGIQDLYDRIAHQLKLSTEATYDCTKICVSPTIKKEVDEFYEANKLTYAGFAVLWCMLGPKAIDTLTDHEVTVEEGWYIPNTTPIAT